MATGIPLIRTEPALSYGRGMAIRIGSSFPAVLLLATVALTGCGTGAPAPSTTTTTAPSATATPTASPTATAAAVTCDTILTEPGRQGLADDGLTEREYTAGRTDLQFMIDAGGVACRWVKPSTDIGATVAQAPFTEAEWDAKQSALETEGYEPTDDPAPGFLLEPTDPAGDLRGGFLWRDGQVYFVSSPSLLNAIPALQE